MGLFEMIVAIVAICSVTEAVKAWAKRPSGKDSKLVLQEIKGLRAEVAALRQQNNDVILSLDQAVDRLDLRVVSLEGRPSLAPPGPSQAESAVAHRAQ
jgi:hypothetical protein